MGIYFNPINASFRQAKNSMIYVDKTGLIEMLNRRLSTEYKCIAVSHARRFGKSHAAGMIDAYYSCACDSSDLFDGTEISTKEDYKKYMNKYNVIHLDIASVWDFHKEDLIESINSRICDDLRKIYAESLDYSKDLYLILQDVCVKTNKQFVIIIDEWDCVVRNSKDDKLVHNYLQFLHSLFKSEESKVFLALAYITGILPIKKIVDESALNNFSEYSMIKSKPITNYYGFTENEVKALCDRYNMDFETMKAWYNGYLIDGIHMYNPNSVVSSIQNNDYDSYWKNTSSFTSINTYIAMNYAGLKDDVVNMLSGGMASVNVDRFQNDLTIINSKDDAITALIHLGYLGYNMEEGAAYVPNYEVKKAYQAALSTGNWNDVAKSIDRCDDLLRATIKGEADRVAELIEMAHETYTSILNYNDENSLSCVLTMAYFTSPAYYNIVREMPAGKGFADMVFIPRANYTNKPAMVIELKYNKDMDSAIKQIKEKRYQGALKGYSDRILLVGINYDPNGKEGKKHRCVIEEYRDI